MNQPVIKILLLAGIAAFAVMAFRGSASARSRLLWRGYGVLVAAAAAVAVLFPDALTQVAQAVGVRRGADLVLYLGAVSFLFVSATVFRRLGQLEQRYVELVRELAVREPQAPQEPGSPGHDGATGGLGARD